MYPHRIEEKLTRKQLGGEWIIEREMTIISKDGTISKFPEYHSSKEEEPTEQPKALNNYYLLITHASKNDFAPHRLPNEKATRMDCAMWCVYFMKCHHRREYNCEGGLKIMGPQNYTSCAQHSGFAKNGSITSKRKQYNNEENPDIAAIIAQQLQTILPQIVTQVTNNVNNANGGNGGNGGNNGCTYKGFITCNPKEYDGKGGAIALTQWIKKIENIIDNSGFQARGREATIGMSWTDFKALLVEEFYPSNEMKKLESEFWNHKMVGANHAGYTNRFHELAKLVPHLVTPESSHTKRYIAGLAPEIRGMLRATQPTTIQSAILRAGILTDESVSCGTLTKGNEKRKGVEESSKQGGGRNDDKRAKVSKGFVAATTHRNEYTGPYPKCAKCLSYRPKGTCYECGSREHYRNNYPKLNLAPGQVGNRLTIEGNWNSRNNGNQLKGRDFNVNAVDALQDPNVVTEVEDGKKVEVDRVIRDCKLKLGTSGTSLVPQKVVKIPLESGETLMSKENVLQESAKALSNVKSPISSSALSDARIGLQQALRVARQGFTYDQEVKFLVCGQAEMYSHVDPSKIGGCKEWKAPTTPS
ncbi:putative reverse transcriptase domain-containing protein [Tanacetum coccineum]